MGIFLDKPKTDKYNEQGEGNGLRYGVSSMQGWRAKMEDAHCSITGLAEGLEDWSFFAVFDGHAGATVSTQCAQQLLSSIIQSEKFQEDILEGIKTGFLGLDSRLRELPDLASGKDKAGSTAVCALISPFNIYIANCGDSRAVLSREGKAVYSTKDHKPWNAGEIERIQKAGGTVLSHRINGSLGVSRSLGDFEYKKVKGRGPCEQLVSPEPEIHVQSRDPLDEFLILACDGIWDVMKTDEVCSYIDYLMRITDDLELIANNLIDTCLHRGSKDNMSVIIVTFPGAQKPSQLAIDVDRSLDEYIAKRIRELSLTNWRNMSLPRLFVLLGNDNIPNLPPGAGLSAKSSLIKSIFTDLTPGASYEIESDDNEENSGHLCEKTKESREMDDLIMWSCYEDGDETEIDPQVNNQNKNENKCVSETETT